MQRLERLAERLRAVDPVVASPGAKIRGWTLVLDAVEKSATSRSRVHPVRRLAVAMVAAAVLVVIAAFAASADSLPDSAFYPLKGVTESVRGALAFSPSDQLAYHLDLAKTRLTESEAMIARHRVDLGNRALTALTDQLKQAAVLVQTEKHTDPAIGAAMENRLRQAVVVHDKQLADLQSQLTNPAAVSAITEARDRAAQVLTVASSPAPTNGAGSPTASPSASGTATSPTATSTP
jgi:hypothetical protein